MTYEEIVSIMEVQGVLLQTTQLDKEYIIPTKEWFLGDFRKSLESWLIDAKVLRWQPESGDCDDFGCWGRAHAKVCNARTNPGKSVVVGEFLYTKESGEQHSVVFGIAGQNKKLYFLDREIDIQGNTWITEVTLSQQELESCFFFYI